VVAAEQRLAELFAAADQIPEAPDFAKWVDRRFNSVLAVGNTKGQCEETTMTVTVLLELKFKPDAVSAARDLISRTLQTTRAFDGNLGTDVLVDEDDEAHWIIYELWDTVEHDEAYRAFRAGDGKVTELPPLLAAPPVKTRYTITDV
jgi:quinol monooxygenase YgiN